MALYVGTMSQHKSLTTSSLPVGGEPFRVLARLARRLIVEARLHQ